MGKIDEVKEEIGWLKVMFGILVISVGIVIINKSAYKKIRQLKDL